MLAKVLSATVIGIDAVPVTVECDVGEGMSSFDLVGLPELAVREARVRVRSAIRQANLPFPQSSVSMTLTPVDLRKDGTSFDLPVALALVLAAGQLPADCLDGWIVVGELSLSGTVRDVTGVLSVADLARELGLRGVLCPLGNAQEALAIAGIEVRGAVDLADVVRLLRTGGPWPVVPDQSSSSVADRSFLCWSDVRGQDQAKRALEVAAAGGHNALMVGLPGSGKTMLARRLPLILPPLTQVEAILATKIHSVAGLLPARTSLLTQRPFRAPHYTCSAAALVGGGTVPKPGEASLAHGGVLFLDELPEFPRHVVESLRQPVEDGVAAVSRGRTTARFPARFLLVASMNACPCGLFGSTKNPCACSPLALERYYGRLPQSLMDRFDIRVQVQRVQPVVSGQLGTGESTATVQARVVVARAMQDARFSAHGGGTNATVTMETLRQTCELAPTVHAQFLRDTAAHGLSVRGTEAVWRVARTIADLEGALDVNQVHVTEALQYRHMDEPKKA